MRVDRYYDKRIVWDKVFADNASEQFEHISYEAVLAVKSNYSFIFFSISLHAFSVSIPDRFMLCINFFIFFQMDSVISMTPFSDDFISARVNNIYPGNVNHGTAAGVFVNLTIQLDGSTVIPNYVQSDLQKQLVAVVHRRNNNIGNSALYVESPTGSISALEGKHYLFFFCSSCSLLI